MATNRDFRDLFFEFNRCSVRYLVVGGYAVAFHGRPRYTKDLDLWVDPDPRNANEVWNALAAFGAPLNDVSPADFALPGRVFQIGVPPNRIDILNRLQGLAFPDAWSRRQETTYDDCKIPMISREDLVTNKRSVARPQDLLDADGLERGRA